MPAALSAHISPKMLKKGSRNVGHEDERQAQLKKRTPTLLNCNDDNVLYGRRRLCVYFKIILCYMKFFLIINFLQICLIKESCGRQTYLDYQFSCGHCGGCYTGETI